MKMTNKKKEVSSTESSSGSTSDSSSSSSSSSGSDSSSSSDSDSSSSQASVKNATTEPKKCIANPKATKKTSETIKTHSSNKQENKPPNKNKPLPKTFKPTPKIDISSSDDEPPTKSNSSKIQQQKKKPPIKSKPSGNLSNKPPLTKPINKVSKPPISKPSQKPKEQSKPSKTSNIKVAEKEDPNKKKSIFSPENSSDESDVEHKPKPPPKPTQKLLGKPQKRPAPKPIAPSSIKKPQKPQEISSATSEDETTSSDSSSTLDSEASTKTTATVRKPIKKPESSKSKSPAKQNHNSNTDSDVETNGKKVVRKSTRSASTRKSKHVLGKNVFSDTDSDTESTKRSLSRSPVKKAPATTKGKAKNKRTDTKTRANDILIKEERKCPLEGCNSAGHLSGKYEKHFTLESCPSYHNMTATQCKQEVTERKKREENRRKILENFKKSPIENAMIETKTYLNKIKEMRSKFKFEPITETKTIIDKTREPILSDFVPDYDLKLFRDAQSAASEKIEEELKTQPNTKGTKYIEMGKYEMEVWYQSPYPEDYARLPRLYICEFCLRYMKSRTVLQRHVVKCVWRHPPGEEVYRKDKISVWEVDGKRYKQYCQNLCLLAKFFLDHKTLYYDVEPFLFYVMTMYDSEGCHTVGYFSKEKNSFLNYNVSCILTLPPYQRQGYGRLLIDFSYLLTRVEGKIGSPEKPLSDLGLISYRSYWKDVLLGYLCANSNTALSVKDISQEMAIHSYDIVSTLQALGMMKYWKGKHIILKKQDVLDEYVDRTKRRGSALKEVDRSCLRWNPSQPATA